MVDQRVVVAIAIVGANNDPLYIRSFRPEEELESHFVAHMALDLIEEKVSSSGDMYLGFLGPIEDNRVYAYVTTTRVKFLLILREGPVKETAVKSVLMTLHTLYVGVISNPFSKIGDMIQSDSFDAHVVQLVEENHVALGSSK